MYVGMRGCFQPTAGVSAGCLATLIYAAVVAVVFVRRYRR